MLRIFWKNEAEWWITQQKTNLFKLEQLLGQKY